MTASATSWARHLAAVGRLEHAGTHSENLFSGSGRPLRWDDALTSWYSEVAAYDFSNPKFKKGSGHFSALVWKSAARVGFGSFGSVAGGQYFVLRFDPPANVEGHFAENVAPASA